jgi:malate dehydrogenase (oxaloacetate-decarboxylating)(NADP+)
VAPEGLEIHNARLSVKNTVYTEFLYNRLQRKGALYRDCQRMVNQNRNVFAAAMVACGDADAMVTGTTRSYSVSLEDIQQAIDPKPGSIAFGLTLLLTRGKTAFIADTTVHELPSPEQLADIAVQAAAAARQMGQEPRVALLSFSNFGNPMRERADRVRQAVALLDQRHVDFEYDGEMGADVALNHGLMRQLYPFCRLTDAANVLIMPALHTANVSAKLLSQLGGGTVIGPLLTGLTHSVQIVELGATVSDVVTMAALAAHGTLTGQVLAKAAE